MKKIILFATIVLITTINFSCKKPIKGCTDSNAINFNANATMNDGSCIAKVFGCTDPSASNYNSGANTDNGTCQYKGDVTFWYNTNGTNATVTIGGYVGYITMYYPTYNPTCGSSGCASFNLPVGTYSYHAESTWSTWDGTVYVSNNGCQLMLLQ